MRVPYTPTNGSGQSYEIESNRHGSYTVTLSGKVVKRVTALPNYLGRPRWGSKRLELEAIQDARNAIELFKSDRDAARSPA
jgi:hypothetical protein